jgi:hypothetical protein
MPGPWLYAISSKSKSTFDFDDGTTPIPVTLESFERLATERKLHRDKKWFVRNGLTAEPGDEIFIYCGDGDTGIVGYAKVAGSGGGPGERFITPDFDYGKTMAFLSDPIPATVVRSWGLRLFPNLVDLSPVMGELMSLLPRTFFRPLLLMIDEQDWTDDEIEKAVERNELGDPVIPTGEVERLTLQRRGHAALAKKTLEDYGGRCAVCDISDSSLLVASHIVGWAEDPATRGDRRNVICLCRLHDALFEAGYWSLSDQLEPVLRESVDSRDLRSFLRRIKGFRRPLVFSPDFRFVRKHRARAGLS